MEYTRFPLWLLLVALTALVGCVNPPDYPEEPVIVYEGVSKTQIYQFTNGPADSLVIQFSYTDGDGDLSGINDSVDITLVDSRFPGERIPFVLPAIPLEGTGNGISGDVFLRIVNVGQELCCLSDRRICAEDPNLPVDTFHYDIQMRDRAGNLSNVISTETIGILCLNQ